VKGAIGYRPDVDGLRALAIIPVVAFHAGLPAFSGGFVGVDVFFVISGFLITGLLLKEQEQDGRIALLDFYARRSRRLLPALAVVMLATLAAGLVLLPPDGRQQDLASSAVFASSFLSNVFFWRHRGGYFSPEADSQPLLHTWTLAVEEQFYVLWPLTIMLLALAARRWGWPIRRALAGVLTAGVAASLVLSLYLTQRAPGAAFYLTPSRAWELGIGALLALAPPPGSVKRPMLAAMLGVAGLAAVLGAVFGFGEDTLFPGLAALLPTLGALAILAAGAITPQNSVSRLLGAAPLRAIGKVSYSWYLWHWPLLAITRVQTLGVRDLTRDLLLALAALVLAILTYVLIEQPIRQRRAPPFRTVRGGILAGLALMLLCIAAAAALAGKARLDSRPGSLAQAVRAARTTDFGALQRCHHVVQTRFGLPPIQACSLGAPAAKASVLLLGDSVAQQLIHPLDAAGRAAGIGVIARTGSGCRPYLRKPSGRPAVQFHEQDCVRFNRAVADELDHLKRDHGLTGVIIAGQWGQLSQDDARALANLVREIDMRGLKVILVAQAPNGPTVSPDCVGLRGEAACVLDRVEAEQVRTSQLTVFGAIARDTPDVAVLDPFETLCDRTICPAVVAGVIAYRDRGHLSRAGAMLLAGAFKRSLTWAAIP
jgi:peptidoglycan/LPS O-acetylase OafA/YrhL